MNKCLTTAVFAVAILLSTYAHAAKTYTAEQLRKMISSGGPPKQGSPVTRTQTLSYAPCVARVNSVVDSVKAQYPTRIIAQTRIMHMAKIWTNDGAMTLTCSQPDSKLVITNAKYL